MTDRKPVDAFAFSLMFALCALWGLQQVIIKLTASQVSLVMQAGLRSLIALALVWVWAAWRCIQLFDRDGTLWAGLAAGLLFSIEFVCIYAGLGHTTASRMVVFVYLAPPLTVFGVSMLLPGERLRAVQWIGVLVSFGGIVMAFADGLSAGGATWLGDLLGVLGAIFWAATTVTIRVSALSHASATKTTFYQLAFSAALLPLASWALGESGVASVSLAVVGSLLYQGVLVAFASYLVWFWLLTRYLASRLSVFSFLTPMFGVVAGVVILHEPLTSRFLVAAALVATGIALVNRRSRAA